LDAPHAICMWVDMEGSHYSYARHKLWMGFMGFYLFQLTKIYIVTCMHLSIGWLSKFGNH
jgi:hypothetical protein